MVVTDEPARAAASSMNFLWTTFTRFEPAADIHAAERRIVRNHIAYRGPIVIDARLKPWFPERADVPRGHRGARVTRAGRSISRPAASRWATRSGRTSIERRKKGRLKPASRPAKEVGAGTGWELEVDELRGQFSALGTARVNGEI